MRLENSYEESHYVSAAQVSQLSTKLRLPESRIKIWFQNRRAREKKKSRKMPICQTTTQTRADKTTDRSDPLQDAEKIAPGPTYFNSCTGYSRTQHTFLPCCALQPANGSYLNHNGCCAMLRVPQTHQFSLNFDYNLYNGLRFYV